MPYIPKLYVPIPYISILHIPIYCVPIAYMHAAHIHFWKHTAMPIISRLSIQINHRHTVIYLAKAQCAKQSLKLKACGICSNETLIDSACINQRDLRKSYASDLKSYVFDLDSYVFDSGLNF